MIIIISVMPLTLFGIRCLFPISSIGETVPWPAENPYSTPQIHRNVYIQFNKMPFIYSPWVLGQVRLTAERMKTRTKEKEKGKSQKKKFFFFLFCFKWGEGSGRGEGRRGG